MGLTLIFATLSAYLLLYGPGHYLLRLASPVDARGSRLFREVLLSLCCSSWIGFVLAELGIYSLSLLLGCTAAVAGLAAVVGRGKQAGAYGTGDLVGVAVVVFTWLWLSPPLDTRILAADSAGYLAGGVHLSRHGSLIIHDPTVPLLPSALQYALFPSVTDTFWAPPYLRLFGSLILSNIGGSDVLPAFHHLIMVWVAIFHSLAGSAAAQWAITLFGGLSVWAMVELAARLCDRATALTFFVLLSLSSLQSWYSRFLMPEIPGQFFVWGGMACVALWQTSRQRSDALLAGLAFGMAGMMRTENAVFGLGALGLGLCFADRPLRAQRLWLIACAAVVWLHAAAHLAHFRTHYIGILQALPQATIDLFARAPGPRLVLLVVAAAALLAWQYRRGFSVLRSMFPLVVLAALVSLWGDWQRGWSGVALLSAYSGIPAVVAGALGLALFAKETAAGDTGRRVLCALAALALIQFFVAPHATPVPIWVARRAATVVVPALCLGAAVLCIGMARRRHWAAAALLLVVTVGGQVKPFAQLRWSPYYEGGLTHLRAVGEMVPPGACVLYDMPLMAWGLAPGLWAERDLPAYLVSRFRPLVIAQILRALPGTPVYWLAEERAPRPQPPGYSATRVGSYSFTLLTPTLDEKTPPRMSNKWDATIAAYELRPIAPPARR